MEDTAENYIKFFSPSDLSRNYYLDRIPRRLSELEKKQFLSDFNEIIELYQIRQYFDNSLYLDSWDKEYIRSLDDTSDKLWESAKKKILQITDKEFEEIVSVIRFDFLDDFLKLIDNLNLVKKISSQSIETLLNKKKLTLYQLLSHKRIVRQFESIIINEMFRDFNGAELLLSSFEQNSEKEFSFPNGLTEQKRKEIIIGYLELDSDKININYLRLIIHANSGNKLGIDDRIKLKARRRKKELESQLFNHDNMIEEGFTLQLSREQLEIVKVENGTYTYSETYLDSQNTDLNLFVAMNRIFGFVSPLGGMTLVSKKSEVTFFDLFGLKSSNEYPDNYNFHKKQKIAFYQILLFKKYLSQKSKSIEDIIQAFAEHLKTKIEGLRFDISETAMLASYSSKIRNFSPILEYLLKQYKCYIEEKFIDFDLLEISSKPLLISDIKSIASRRYIYLTESSKLKEYIYMMFSDQSPIYYIENYSKGYRNLYSLLDNEDIKLEYFLDFQQKVILKLVDCNFLTITESSHVKISNLNEIKVLKDFYLHEYLSYWFYNQSQRNLIDNWVESNDINFSNDFLSKVEIDYWNYYLNSKSFTNGKDIRNKYAHGSNSVSESEQFHDYHWILILTIMLLLKIYYDLYFTEKESQ